MGIQDCYEMQFGGFYEEISGKLMHRMTITNLSPEICKKNTRPKSTDRVPPSYSSCWQTRFGKTLSNRYGGIEPHFDLASCQRGPKGIDGISYENIGKRQNNIL